MTPPKIVVLDERNGALRSDNVNDYDGAKYTVDHAAVLVVVGQDGVFVKEGVGKVALITTKSEAELSANKAAEHLAARQCEEPQPHEDHITRLKRAWKGPDNSGTERIGG